MIEIIALATVVTCAALCYNFYKTGMRDRFKLACLPLVLLVAGLLGYHYIDQLGRPFQGFPEDKFEYIHHLSNPSTTELWAKIDGESRLFAFPYSKENEKQLEKAKSRSRAGIPSEGKFEINKDGKNIIPNWEVPAQDPRDRTEFGKSY